jgi:hypothetical protein
MPAEKSPTEDGKNNSISGRIIKKRNKIDYKHGMNIASDKIVA